MAYNQNTRETIENRQHSIESKSPRDSGRSKKSTRDSSRSKGSYQSSDQEFGISRVLGSKATKSLKLFAYTSLNSLLLLKLLNFFALCLIYKKYRKISISVLPNRYGVMDVDGVFLEIQ